MPAHGIPQAVKAHVVQHKAPRRPHHAPKSASRAKAHSGIFSTKININRTAKRLGFWGHNDNCCHAWSAFFCNDKDIDETMTTKGEPLTRVH